MNSDVPSLTLPCKADSFLKTPMTNQLHNYSSALKSKNPKKNHFLFQRRGRGFHSTKSANLGLGRCSTRQRTRAYHGDTSGTLTCVGSTSIYLTCMKCDLKISSWRNFRCTAAM